MKIFILISLCYLLNSCASSPSRGPITPIQSINNTIQELTENCDKPFIGHPQPNNYSICHGHTGAEFSFISLSNKQWQTIESIFFPISSDPQQEREQIKLAIAQLEIMSEQKAGTDKDFAENDTSHGFHGQLDCIDEATNSTVYLRILQQAGLLTFHRQSSRTSRTSRGGLFSPHNTATIIQNNSNTRYAVDSWFGANGEPPAIILLPQWEDGWMPTNH